MRKILLILLLTLFAMVPLGVCAQQEQSFTKASASDMDNLSLLRQRYTPEHPLIYEDAWEKWPYVFINDEGEPDGFNVEIVKALMERLKIPYEIRLKNQDQAHEDLRNNLADLSFGVAASYNASWGQFGNVTVTLFENAMLQPRKDSLHPLNVNDLRDMRFSVSAGSRAYHYILSSEIPDSLITTVENMEAEILRGVSRGTGNYIWNTMMMKWVVNKYHIKDFAVTPIDMPAGEYRLMSADTLLLHNADSVVRLMKAEGKIERMETRWMYPERKEPSHFYIHLTLALLLLMSVAIFVILCIQHYRKYYSRNSLSDITSQMGLILQANNIKVWVYYPTTRRYAWMDEEGRVDKEYSSFEFSQFYPEGDFNVIHTHVMEFLSQDSAKVVETLRSYSLHDLNTVIDVEIHMEAMKDDYGKIYLICGVQYDITDSKAALERMRLLHERHRIAFNLAMGGIMRFDATGRMIDINERMLVKLGIKDREELLSQDYNIHDFGVFDNVNLDDVPNDLCFCSAIENSEMGNYVPFSKYSNFNPDVASYPFIINEDDREEMELTVPDKGYYYVHFIKSYDTRGNFICYLLYIRDITAEVMKQRQISRMQRHAQWMEQECQLYKSNRDFALSENNIWMLRYNVDTKMLSIFEEGTSHKVKYSQLQVLEMVDSKHLKKAFKVMHNVEMLDPSDINLTVGTLIRNKEGQQRYFKIDAHPMYDATGKIYGYFGICTDITTQVYTERQLKYETRKAHEAEHVKQNFLKNMSYSIRQPLVTMQQSIEKLGAMESETLQMQMIEDITINTQRLIMLSDDTLLLSRIEAGLYVLDEGDHDFVPVFYDSVNQGLQDYRTDSVSYNISNAYETLTLHFDKKVVARIIIEAVGLSARYTNFGSVSVRYMHRKGMLTFAVEDNGQGIPPAMLENIYEPRLGDIYTPEMHQHHISGLEMPICQALVKLLNGTIDIDSQPGRGTSIYITLPIRDE